MKLLSLRLRGAIGIREGLGLEEVNVDFREFSPGLIAIMGENGAGKTTFIENLHPFRFLKSRPGGLARQFFLKDSCRDLLLAIGEDEYRFLIEMNPTLKTPFTKSYVYKNGECLNMDGNAEGYDEIVIKLFGDPDLFFSSLFMTQRRVPFSKIDAAKRKDLLLELIGAGHLQTKCDYATQSGKALREEIAGVSGQIETLSNGVRPIEEIDTDISLCQKALDADRVKLVDHDTEILASKTALEGLQTRQTAQAVKQSELSTAKSTLASIENDLTNVAATFRTKTGQLKIFIGGDQEEIIRLTPLCDPTAEAAIDAKIVAADKAKTEYLATVESRQKYDALAQEYVRAVHELEVADRDYVSAIQRLKSNVVNAQNILDNTKTKVDAKRKELTDEIARKTRATITLQTVPCQDETIPVECRDACKSCQFLKDATAAVTELAGLSARLATGEEAWTTLSASLNADIATAQAAVDNHPSWESISIPLQAKIDAAAGAIRGLDFDKHAADAAKDRYEELEDADYPAQKRKIAEARAKLEAITQRISDRQKQLADLQSEESTEIEALKQKAEAVRSEIAALEPQIDIMIELRMREVREKLKVAEPARQSTVENTIRLEANIARLTEDRTKAGRSTNELNEAEAKLATLQTDLADWDHLAQSLSRNGGFQSMLVENAGAEITPFANELLTLYGRPWTIEIATCKPSADGKKLVDGFYVTVNTPNGPRELSDLSGGEEVIVDQVIYDSIGNMLRRRSGLLLQTAIKDESDGSLDGDRALDYVKAVEAAHRLSGMNHTLLISHRESIQDLISNRIRFTKGLGITLEAA